MILEATLEYPDPESLIGLIYLEYTKPGPSSQELQDELKALIEARKNEDSFTESFKQNLRHFLKASGFKPSGRNKAASEYLAQAAREDRFPLIHAAVDCNNLYSLKTGLPISLLDARFFTKNSLPQGPLELLLRPGKPGETYCFNQSGQEIDLEGLLSVCSLSQAPYPGEALGNPVKDSLKAKLNDSSRYLVGIIYAAQSLLGQSSMEDCLKGFGELLERHCARVLETRVLTNT